MTMGAQPAAAWEEAESAEDPGVPAEDSAPAVEREETSADIEMPTGLRESAPAFALGAIGLAWVALSFWGALDALVRAPSLGGIAQWLAITSAPLALIGVLYLLLGRTSRREARRFVTAARAMRLEAAHLEQAIAAMGARIDASRMALGEQAHQLLLMGDDAAARIAEIGTTLARETAALGEQTLKLESASADARVDMGVLLSDLPKAEAQTRDFSDRVKETGMSAHQQVSALQAELATMAAKGREADETLGTAAQRLTAHFAQIESSAAAAAHRLNDTADQARGALDGVLAQAAETLDEAHRGISAQNVALLAMVEAARASLEGAGGDAAASLTQRLDLIAARLEGYGKTLAAQETGTGALLSALEQKLGGLTQRLESLAADGGRQLQEIGSAVAVIGQQTETLDATIGETRAHTDALVDRAAALRDVLEATSTTLGDALPAALSRLEEQATRSQEAISAAAVDAAALLSSATATSARLGESEAALQRQQAILDALGSAAATQLGALETQAAALEAAIDRAGSTASRVAEGAGPQLIEALVRVREAASQAAQKAREAIADVIPEATRALAHAAGPAAADALDARVEAQLATVSAASQRAVQAAHHATERLMRQMLTIADTTTAIESRIAEAKSELEEQDQDASARRVALLIESLNSIAIDVTKILSNDVTDSAWAAYLKGDRGIFTRRAVRLLDTTEAREIVRHYEEEPEFRDQVNHYVHDFEAMLRRVLSTRDGSPLGITLLSSDMGKLYVALAQAIERLRA